MKKILFFLCIVLMVFSVTSVSAADDFNQTTYDLDAYSFDDFQYDVNGQSNVILQHDYINTYDLNDFDDEYWDIYSWSINTPVEIDGNGHVLDWNNCPNPIYIYADNVKIKNTIFKNFSNYSHCTNAIDWQGNNGLLENCTFINNNYDSELISINGDKVRINGCKFSNNTGGGLIWLSGENCKITNNEFSNNNVNQTWDNLICAYANSGKISKNVFMNNKDVKTGKTCINLFEGMMGLFENNYFLNSGVVINEGLVEYANYAYYGDVIEGYLIDNESKIIYGAQDVMIHVIIDFYNGNVDFDEDVELFKNITLTYNVKSDEDGYVHFNINDLLFDYRLSNESVVYDFSNSRFVKTDHYNVKNQSSQCRIIFKYGDSESVLYNMNVLSSIDILKGDCPYLIEEPVVREYLNHSRYDLSVMFFNNCGDAVPFKKVTLKIANRTYFAKTNKYGVATFNVVLKYGNNQVILSNPVTYQQFNYSMNIVKHINNNKDVTKYYKGNEEYTFKVLDKKGNPVKDKYVFVSIGNVEKFVKTDKNGNVAIKLNQKPGKYVIKVQYKDHVVTNKIVIKSTIITKDLFKKSRKFQVKVLNSKGKAVSNKFVKIKFKSKTYKLKTNKNGIATFKLPKNLKNGKYLIKTTYNGYSVKNKIVVRK